MSWPRALPWIALLLLAGLVLGDVGLPGTGGEETLAPGGSARARLERVVDGDTIVVDVDGARERVRYIGLDTPETVKPDAPVECHGHAAHDLNVRLLGAPGSPLTLRFDRELRDPYGRLLAYVHRADGVLVNARLVRAGAARTLSIPPNTAHARELAGWRRRRAAPARGCGGAARVSGPMKMRQSLAQLERAFAEEMARDRHRRERLKETATQRSLQRRRQRVHKHGSMRFALLVLSIVVTAVVVTIVMFETLYYVMG